MLMLCWFYCIPFAKMLYYASSPLLILFSFFVLKRGMRLGRVGLRQMAFLLMFLSALKVCVFDLRMTKKELLCGPDPYITLFDCNARGMQMLEFAGLLAFCALSAAIFHFYRLFLPQRKWPKLKPEDVHLRFWANISLLSVFAMIVWTMAPWVGYLTIGGVPALFTTLRWQHFAIANFILLMIGFWKVESCNWHYDPKDKNKSMQASQSWTPRDTLWLNVFLYLVTLGLSYVAHDILKGHMQ